MIEPGVPDDEDLEAEIEVRRDADHLRLVTVLLVVYAPLALLPFLGVLFAGAFLQSLTASAWMFLPVLATAIGAVAPAVLAWWLSQRHGRTRCVVLAFLTAWSWPGGTIVGVAALLVLARPSVAELFEEADAARKNADPGEARGRAALRSARRRARRRAAAPPPDPAT